MERAKAQAERGAELYNQTRGQLTGYDCKECLNRGDFMYIELEHGVIYQRTRPCKCRNIRRNLQRLESSGLKNAEYQTFDSFEAAEDWQIRMKNIALDYAAHPEGWLFFGGQVGCGKTHLCTAVCARLIQQGHNVLYVTWPDRVTRLKALVNDCAEYEKELRRLKTAEILYLDDFFKPAQDAAPSAADIKLAYDLINYRYINRMPTIISSERSSIDLINIDEATGTRIYDLSKRHGMTIMQDGKRNYRMRQ